MSIHKVTANVGGEITIETGKMARLADGAVTVRMGDTMVIVTAVSDTKMREGIDFFPLSVEYKEKASAAEAFRKRGSHLPDDRPPAAAAVPKRLPL
jgi:polyribonucleotide nucleotidyltransferase